MAVTAYKFAGTAANVDQGAGAAWSNPSNANADDGLVTSTATMNNNNSDYLRLTNFGFTSSDVPAGATINGIEIEVQRRRSGTSTDFHDEFLFLRNGSAAQVGDNKATGTLWTNDLGYEIVTYGGAADTWNAGLTQADIVDTDFGLDYSCVEAAFVNSTGIIDYVKLRVYYTAGLPAGVQHMNVNVQAQAALLGW